jgi:hypothetical protein
MLISVLHPSYKRPEQAHAAYQQWRNASEGEFQYILSLDARDVTKDAYLELYANEDITIIQSGGDCVVAATNDAAPFCEGELIIYMSDDFEAPKGWDVMLSDIIRNKGIEGGMYLLQVGDNYQSDRAILTIPIMSKALYRHLGYFWNPLYRSMWVDNDLFFTCLDLKCMVDVRDKISFTHNHFSNGKSSIDETYRQSQANWKQGEKVFKKRARENRWKWRS